jgi:hypothetical protein
MYKLPTAIGLISSALLWPFAVTAQLPAGGLQVLGIEIAQPETSSKGLLESATIQNGLVLLKVQGFRNPVSISPWHGALPDTAYFARSKTGKQNQKELQEVQVYRAMNPFGPTQRVSISRQHQAHPWLTVLTGGQSGQKVVGEWAAMNSADRWWLVNGTQKNAQRMYVKGVQIIRADNATWCFYPSARAAGPEQPPLLDWVLVQQSPGSKICSR